MNIVTARAEEINSSSAYLLTDSRKLIFPENSLFIAIKGIHHDGHQYIIPLYHAGIREFIVEEKAITQALRIQWAELKEGTMWIVDDSVKALQQLAARKRAASSISVTGITGSNGKTIVKEWLSALLAPDYKVLSSPKSFNSQIGVPLSVWPLNDTHQIAVFEAGISQPHEMEYLEKIIKPDIGIFTNIGTAHDEGFKSIKQKISEKLRLFTHAKKLIFRADYQNIQEEVDLLLKSVNPGIKCITWATEAPAMIRVRYENLAESTLIHLLYAEKSLTFKSTYKDQASLENLVHCIIYLTEAGMAEEIIQNRISLLQPVSMRLEIKDGIYHSNIIDDTYNNDLQGLIMALDFLKENQRKPRKVLILSDLLQTGIKPADLYQSVNQIIVGHQIDLFIGIGPNLTDNSTEFSSVESCFFENTTAFLKSFNFSELTDSLVLVKGARPFAFERIVYRLQKKNHHTILEINLDALTHNLNFYKEFIGKQTKIMVMVKAFAYGSGSMEVASLLQHHRVDYLAVAYPDEGVALRNNGITLPIMVMNADPESYDILIRYDLEPEIYSRRTLLHWLQNFKTYDSRPPLPPVHLKIDTGMHRLGFIRQDMEWLKEEITAHPQMKIASIFTHLAGADDEVHDSFTRNQYQLLNEAAQEIESVIDYKPIRHILNSAGIISYPEFRLDMVRLGIGIYGVDSSGKNQSQLKVVGTLRTIISQIKDYSSGETIGYSRKGVITQHSKIATIAMGYADGLDRRCGNGNSKVLVNGTLCPTIGNICMDMAMIDITHAKAEEGDEVIIFGENPDISTVARQIGTIPYEFLTGINERVNRVFFKE